MSVVSTLVDVALAELDVFPGNMADFNLLDYAMDEETLVSFSSTNIGKIGRAHV